MQGAISDCTAALAVDPRNLSALLLRAVAKNSLRDYQVSYFDRQNHHAYIEAAQQPPRPAWHCVRCADYFAVQGAEALLLVIREFSQIAKQRSRSMPAALTL